MFPVGANNCWDGQRFGMKSSVPRSDRIVIAVQSISRRGETDGLATARQGVKKMFWRSQVGDWEESEPVMFCLVGPSLRSLTS